VPHPRAELSKADSTHPEMVRNRLLHREYLSSREDSVVHVELDETTIRASGCTQHSVLIVPRISRSFDLSLPVFLPRQYVPDLSLRGSETVVEDKEILILARRLPFEYDF
jgi:hypothetical protein